MLKDDIDPKARYIEHASFSGKSKIVTGQQLLNFLDRAKMAFADEVVFLIFWEETSLAADSLDGQYGSIQEWADRLMEN